MFSLVEVYYLTCRQSSVHLRIFEPADGSMTHAVVNTMRVSGITVGRCDIMKYEVDHWRIKVNENNDDNYDDECY